MLTNVLILMILILFLDLLLIRTIFNLNESIEMLKMDITHMQYKAKNLKYETILEIERRRKENKI